MGRTARIAQSVLLGSAALAADQGQNLPPEDLTPIGRVCLPRSFRPAEPNFFVNPGFIAVGPDSNLYSTSMAGGKHGLGTIFRISPAGQVKILFDFDGTNGSNPQSGLVAGGDGWLYGTTYGGGKHGVGTIFRIRHSDGAREILHHFRNGSTLGLQPDCSTPNCPYTPRQRADIAAGYPSGPPVRAANGVLYGVTPYSNNQGFGVLYRLAPPYDPTHFHALCIFDHRMLADREMAPFVCKPDITFPWALVLDSTRGVLYGTTLGGTNATLSSHGAVFRATTSGDISVLHEFDLAGGSKPNNLLLARDGQLYGTTSGGGDANLGIVYRLNPDTRAFLVKSTLHLGRKIQGEVPLGGLVEAVGRTGPDGPIRYLYGTTQFGGKWGRGILFRIPLDGGSLDLRVLHEFETYTSGRMPISPLVLGPRGLLYGLTYLGGSHDNGAFYTLNPAVMPDAPLRVAEFTGGVPARNDEGFLLNDPMIEVRTGVTASRVNEKGETVIPHRDGILVRARCPNPHIVQFVHTDRISLGGDYLPGVIHTLAGDFPYNPAHPRWYTDRPAKNDPAFFGHYNAYLDQMYGAAHQTGPTAVTIFDEPSFEELAVGETERYSFRDFVFCNCQLTREVRWSREDRKLDPRYPRYTHIGVFRPAPAVLDTINKLLRLEGYAPVP